MRVYLGELELADLPGWDDMTGERQGQVMTIAEALRKGTMKPEQLAAEVMGVTQTSELHPEHRQQALFGALLFAHFTTRLRVVPVKGGDVPGGITN